MTRKLTVIIPCKNEIANIRGCLHSARKVADELLIADSGSTDGTLEWVRSEADTRVIEREYVNSGNFKNWAIPQATHPWVLILDADERIPDRLAAEIREVLQSAAPADGYWLPRAGYFMGHRVRFSGWQNDRVLRLFRRDAGRYNGESDHAEVVVRTGRVGRLRNRLQHYTYWNYHDYFRRFERYATYQAERWYAEGRPVSRFKLFCNFPLRFLQLYLLRLGFLDGLVGLQICALTALYSFAKQACLWQLRDGRSREAAGRDATDVIVADRGGQLPRHVILAARHVMDEPNLLGAITADGPQGRSAVEGSVLADTALSQRCERYQGQPRIATGRTEGAVIVSYRARLDEPLAGEDGDASGEQQEMCDRPSAHET